MGRRGNYGFVDAFKAEGIGHTTETEYKPFDIHCPQMGNEGLNMYKESCEERRRGWLHENSPCKRYPDCKPLPKPAQGYTPESKDNRAKAREKVLRERQKRYDKRDAEMVEMYDQGVSVDEIRKHYGFKSYSSVYRVIGRRTETKDGDTNRVTVMVADYLRKGHSYPEIIKATGLSSGSINHHKKKALKDPDTYGLWVCRVKNAEEQRRRDNE